ncbi:MAG: restriction endonuclease, partial [Rhodothermales bacterium]
ARTYLKQAGLLDAPRRGYFAITEDGQSLLAEHPEQIDTKLLERYPAFMDFKNRRRDRSGNENRTATSENGLPNDQSPDDALASAYQKLRSDLEAALLQQVKDLSPSFFERLVVDLLVNMGYGGSREDAGQAIGRGGDGGIDGIINEDRLGLDVIYLQAKRWEGTVGRPEIQKFAGALQGQRARKGVFITTSNFSKEAKEYADFIDTRIVLVDGERMARLMVDHNVGVSTVGTYDVKKIDTDYFTDE